MDGKILIQGVGVCAAVFAVLHFLPIDQLLKPSPPAYTMGPLTGRVDETFQKVGPDNRPQAVQDAEMIDMEVKRAEVYAKMSGHTVRPEAEVRAAIDDAPKLATYVGYGTLPKMTEPMIETRDIDTAGMKVACFSVRDPGFDSDSPPESRHLIILYDATRHVANEFVELATWVYSGCAEAVRSSPNLSVTQYKTTLRDTYPATPEYDAHRQKIMQSLNSNPKKDRG